MWRSDSAAAVWLMPAGGAAWMVVWIMLGPCAVPLVHVVRYYPFRSIVVSLVTHLLVWLSPGMGRHGWLMGGWLNPRTLGWAQDALCLVYVVILAAAWQGPGRGMEDAIRVFPPLMPTWQGTDWRRAWGRPFPCRLWGSDHEGHPVQGVPPVHVV